MQLRGRGCTNYKTLSLSFTPSIFNCFCATGHSTLQTFLLCLVVSCGISPAGCPGGKLQCWRRKRDPNSSRSYSMTRLQLQLHPGALHLQHTQKQLRHAHHARQARRHPSTRGVASILRQLVLELLSSWFFLSFCLFTYCVKNSILLLTLLSCVMSSIWTMTDRHRKFLCIEMEKKQSVKSALF